MSLDPHIKSLTTKLTQVLKQYQLLEKDNEQLRARLLQKKEQENILLEKMTELEQRITLLKASGGSLSKEDKLELEKTINRHLKEIDRCITFLSE